VELFRIRIKGIGRKLEEIKKKGAYGPSRVGVKLIRPF